MAGEEKELGYESTGLIYMLDADAAVQTVFEKTGPATCPFCTNDKWLVESSGDGKADPVFVIKDPRAHFGPAPAIPAVALSCSNCGFIRLHNIAVANRKG